MYLKVPGAVKVTRNRVTPGDDCASPTLSWGDARRIPECTLSVGEPITPCRAPSESVITPEGGAVGGLLGSIPNVTVWPTVGPKFTHSTVSPTWTTILSPRNRITAEV